ncbi:hypothetical protein GCM10007866_13210 [Gluconobacter albidus]|uniref:Uncharacterized protein n=1 Tax=Gluconobacter albidus TaxID=318683 RepID=A0AAW3R1A3_9PROT|nr:hypothetical protein AD941_00960 [Gluconobacter albidus]GBQ93564.1 hypothetical protein AA3250_2868 [Gluconobacter albidus NBRC 3250]GLQ68870.1 hypothetical protein GCM10007866_13210 [Gluconobacter albidus]
MSSPYALTETSGVIALGRRHIPRILGGMLVMLVVIDNSLSSQAMNTSVSEKRRATLWLLTCRRKRTYCLRLISDTRIIPGQGGEQTFIAV